MEKIFCQDIEDSEFARLDDSEKDSEFVAVESKTYFQDAWGRFKKNKLALVSLVFMAVVILFAVFDLLISVHEIIDFVCCFCTNVFTIYI